MTIHRYGIGDRATVLVDNPNHARLMAGDAVRIVGQEGADSGPDALYLAEDGDGTQWYIYGGHLAPLSGDPGVTCARGCDLEPEPEPF
jgi:hypothetical protein